MSEIPNMFNKCLEFYQEIDDHQLFNIRDAMYALQTSKMHHSVEKTPLFGNIRFNLTRGVPDLTPIGEVIKTGGLPNFTFYNSESASCKLVEYALITDDNISSHILRLSKAMFNGKVTGTLLTPALIACYKNTKISVDVDVNTAGDTIANMYSWLNITITGKEAGNVFGKIFKGMMSGDLCFCSTEDEIERLPPLYQDMIQGTNTIHRINRQDCEVNVGYNLMYNVLREKLLYTLLYLMNFYKVKKVVIGGYDVGGVFANMLGFDLKLVLLGTATPQVEAFAHLRDHLTELSQNIFIYTFGCPEFVNNNHSREIFNENVNCWRFQMGDHGKPRDTMIKELKYFHVGTEVDVLTMVTNFRNQADRIEHYMLKLTDQEFEILRYGPDSFDFSKKVDELKRTNENVKKEEVPTVDVVAHATEKKEEAKVAVTTAQQKEQLYWEALKGYYDLYETISRKEKERDFNGLGEHDRLKGKLETLKLSITPTQIVANVAISNATKALDEAMKADTEANPIGTICHVSKIKNYIESLKTVHEMDNVKKGLNLVMLLHSLSRAQKESMKRAFELDAIVGNEGMIAVGGRRLGRRHHGGKKQSKKHQVEQKQNRHHTKRQERKGGVVTETGAIPLTNGVEYIRQDVLDLDARLNESHTQLVKNIQSATTSEKEKTKTELAIPSDLLEGNNYVIGIDNTKRIIYISIKLDIGLKHLLRWDTSFKDLKVHKGYILAYQALLFPSVIKQLRTGGQLNTDMSTYKFYITGHSEGGPVANLLAYDLASGLRDLDGVTIITTISADQLYVYTYGAPNFLDKESYSRFHAKIPQKRILRFIFIEDRKSEQMSLSLIASSYTAPGITTILKSYPKELELMSLGIKEKVAELVSPSAVLEIVKAGADAVTKLATHLATCGLSALTSLGKEVATFYWQKHKISEKLHRPEEYLRALHEQNADVHLDPSFKVDHTQMQTEITRRKDLLTYMGKQVLDGLLNERKIREATNERDIDESIMKKIQESVGVDARVENYVTERYGNTAMGSTFRGGRGKKQTKRRQTTRRCFLKN